MITIRSVDALEPGQVIWDDKVIGFGARRQLNAVAYVIKYRVHGKQRFVTLGRHGVLTPDQARREAKRLLGEAAGGNDPARDKSTALGKVIDKYLEYAEKTQRPSTYGDTKRYLKVNYESLHGCPIAKLKRRDVTKELAKIEAKHGPIVAARARAALSAFFNWAIGDGYDLVANPVTGTNKPPEPKSKERVLSDTELTEIWSACGDDDYGRIVRLLMLTAQRRDEVGGLMRSEIIGDLWTIPGERTKNHQEHKVPLSAPALEIIEKALGSTNRDFAFGSGPRKNGDKDRGFSGWSKSKAELDKQISVTDWTLHDLRRTAATVMADKLGVLPHIVEAILNHISGHKAGVAGIYNRARYLPQMRESLDKWAAHIAGIANGDISRH
jgi:integrase